MLSWVVVFDNIEARLICINKREKKRAALSLNNSEWIVSYCARYDVRSITFDTYSPAFYTLIKWVSELNPDPVLPKPPEDEFKKFMKLPLVRFQIIKEIA